MDPLEELSAQLQQLESKLKRTQLDQDRASTHSSELDKDSTQTNVGTEDKSSKLKIEDNGSKEISDQNQAANQHNLVQHDSGDSAPPHSDLSDNPISGTVDEGSRKPKEPIQSRLNAPTKASLLRSKAKFGKHSESKMGETHSKPKWNSSSRVRGSNVSVANQVQEEENNTKPAVGKLKSKSKFEHIKGKAIFLASQQVKKAANNADGSKQLPTSSKVKSRPHKSKVSKSQDSPPSPAWKPAGKSMGVGEQKNLFRQPSLEGSILLGSNSTGNVFDASSAHFNTQSKRKQDFKSMSNQNLQNSTKRSTKKDEQLRVNTAASESVSFEGSLDSSLKSPHHPWAFAHVDDLILEVGKGTPRVNRSRPDQHPTQIEVSPFDHQDVDAGLAAHADQEVNRTLSMSASPLTSLPPGSSHSPTGPLNAGPRKAESSDVRSTLSSASSSEYASDSHSAGLLSLVKEQIDGVMKNVPSATHWKAKADSRKAQVEKLQQQNRILMSLLEKQKNGSVVGNNETAESIQELREYLNGQASSPLSLGKSSDTKERSITRVNKQRGRRRLDITDPSRRTNSPNNERRRLEENDVLDFPDNERALSVKLSKKAERKKAGTPQSASQSMPESLEEWQTESIGSAPGQNQQLVPDDQGSGLELQQQVHKPGKFNTPVTPPEQEFSGRSPSKSHAHSSFKHAPISFMRSAKKRAILGSSSDEEPPSISSPDRMPESGSALQNISAYDSDKRTFTGYHVSSSSSDDLYSSDSERAPVLEVASPKMEARFDVYEEPRGMNFLKPRSTILAWQTPLVSQKLSSKQNLVESSDNFSGAIVPKTAQQPSTPKIMAPQDSWLDAKVEQTDEHFMAEESSAIDAGIRKSGITRSSRLIARAGWLSDEEDAELTPELSKMRMLSRFRS